MAKEKKKENKNIKKSVVIIGAIALSVGIGTSNVAFADQNIGGLMSSWFDKQESESIKEIDQEIDNAKAEQMSRLKTELSKEMSNSAQQLDALTESEKQKSVNELKAYADQIIQQTKDNNQAERNQVKKELDGIVNAALSEMGAVDIPEPKVEVKEENVGKKEETKTEPLKEAKPQVKEESEPEVKAPVKEDKAEEIPSEDTSEKADSLVVEEPEKENTSK